MNEASESQELENELSAKSHKRLAGKMDSSFFYESPLGSIAAHTTSNELKPAEHKRDIRSNSFNSSGGEQETAVFAVLGAQGTGVESHRMAVSSFKHPEKRVLKDV